MSIGSQAPSGARGDAPPERSGWDATTADARGLAPRRRLDAPPGSLEAVLGSLRWAAIVLGVAFAAPRARTGELAIVATLAVVLFHTTWRSLRPLAASPSGAARSLAVVDAVVVGAAIGLSDGLTGPFVPSLLVVVAGGALGWGLVTGGAAAIAGIGAVTAVTALSGVALPLPTAVGVSAVIGAAALPGVAHRWLARAEDRGHQLADEVAGLRETNRLLHTLNDLARSLPTNLDLEEVLAVVRGQVVGRFDADRIVVLTTDDDRWHPQLVDGLDLGPAAVLDELPAPLDEAVASPAVLRLDDLSTVADRTGSGLYGRLIVDGVDVGLLGIESERPGHFDDGALELFDGIAEVVALTVENARSFGRLRSLAAADERSRIARDLHDRLGQWLTYINLEIERINGGLAEPHAELDRLQGDVQAAIAELRDALVELRTTIRSERPLSVVLPEVVGRFEERTGLRVELALPPDPEARLSGVVENELLRIAQESLTNIEKHADARTVHITWSVDDGRGVLTIEDDGRGFDPGRGIRSTAYGLVGMRERAAAVGAILEIASRRGIGTVITVLVGPTQELSR